ncbi:MAG: hypothetical protein PHU93_01190 [Candidatus Gracilibacteria bacterium]|nr:hypothetical protein [Candidatus Gracilibacteria bacterium]
MALDKNNFTTIAIDKDLKIQLDNLLIVLHGVQIKTPSDKIKYLLHEYSFKEKKI